MALLCARAPLCTPNARRVLQRVSQEGLAHALVRGPACAPPLDLHSHALAVVLQAVAGLSTSWPVSGARLYGRQCVHLVPLGRL